MKKKLVTIAATLALSALVILSSERPITIVGADAPPICPPSICPAAN